MKPLPQPWSERESEEAKRLWGEGFSAAQVARLLGTGRSRNAVIGRLNRLGAPRRNAPAANSDHASRAPRITARRRAMLRTSKPPKAQSPPEYFAPPVAPLFDVQLSALNSFTCRYPFGDPAEPGFTFCGRTCRSDQSYCTDHARLCYTPGARKKRQMDATARLVNWLDRRSFKAAGA